MDNKNELTLRDLILIIKSYLREVVRNWLIILVFVLPFFGYYIYNTLKTESKYYSEVKFIVEDDGDSNMSSISGLLGNFGVSGGTKFNYNQISQIAYANRQLAEFLFSNSTCENDMLINVILSEYNLNELWSNDNYDLTNFKFVNRSIDSLELKEKYVFKRLVNAIRKESFGSWFSIRYDLESSIYTISSDIKSECLSLEISDKSFKNIKNLYKQKIFAEKLKAHEKLGEKRDSLKILIESKLIQIGKIEDANRNMIFAVDQVKKKKLRLELELLNSVFIEANKRYEIADMSLMNRPIFYMFDKSISPLEPHRPSLLERGLLGLILGLFIGISFVVLRKMYNDAIV